MPAEPLTYTEKQQFEKYFSIAIDAIDMETFQRKRKELLQKYHPDKFEKHDDPLVREMAHDKFRDLEQLCEKAKDWLENKQPLKETAPSTALPPEQYAADGMYIEVITRDKDLKYHLFGSHYRWLESGDKYEIPGTKAFIRIESNYKGTSIGYSEAIKMYVSFGVNDSVTDIVNWLYNRINGSATSLLIAKQLVAIEPEAMARFIKKKTVLKLQAPE